MKKLKVFEVSITPAGKLGPKGYGWAEVSVQFEDLDVGMLPSVAVKVHVPYEPSDTYAVVRERSLQRAREILKAASMTLDASLADLDKLAR